MYVSWRLLLAVGLLCGLSGCFAISLPNKVVINQPAPSKPAPQQTLAPCNLSDLPSPPADRRPTLAVLDFQVGEDIGADVGRALADLCRDAIQDSGRFVLVDRQRIADVLSERDFAEAMQCDSTVCLIRYGKLLGAQKMMQGRINRLGEVFVLAVGMTDVSTGAQVSKTTSLASVEESTDAVPSLVCQILRSANAEAR